MKRNLIILSAALALVLSACSNDPAPAVNPAPQPTTSVAEPTTGNSDVASEGALLEANGLTGMTGDEIITLMDPMSMSDKPKGDFNASVRWDHVLVKGGDIEAVVPFDTNKFYLSIAPYVTETHECFYHSLSGCLGELRNKQIDVRITGPNDEVLVNETMTTWDNGFIGFWLPQGIEGTLEMTYDGKTAKTPFSTNAEAATCLTTLQLK